MACAVKGGAEVQLDDRAHGHVTGICWVGRYTVAPVGIVDVEKVGIDGVTYVFVIHVLKVADTLSPLHTQQCVF